ncbi:hypothetical protein FF38_11329 [Lucilia cuprina]|uniref:GAF domain-containing protein n=1 Tax=Lucilia cuprina TaxID=7375 RepID=A0A0L0CB88_LUCCU|nr:hypothetical protein FF38_11329 [Lucilia cuprina]
MSLNNTKSEGYELLLAQVDALLVSNWISNLSNVSALLYEHFHSQEGVQKDVNWCGFYLANKSANTLELGPFQGKVACQVIEIGKGVCGTSASSLKTVVVKDVHLFPGHIACDAESASEIVVPILYNNEIRGVIDIDCKSLNGFDEVDARYLEIIAEKLSSGLNF